MMRIGIADYPLPHLDEPVPPFMGQYQNGHTKEWAAKIGSFDGFIFVTPEYNHSTSGALKNAIDYLFAEWNNKAVGIVSYGSVGGARAAEHLRLIAGELKMADVRTGSPCRCSPTSLTSANRSPEPIRTRRWPRSSMRSSPGAPHSLTCANRTALQA
ncbi:NADPH-dependent FMN reductase [Streptacidiphilus pinicola]|uniref:NADPH-dependent FMN reductase n=1 Tax=Streptacidiphilus pinicola TaxID=2219663 RepID=UPI0026AA8C93